MMPDSQQKVPRDRFKAYGSSLSQTGQPVRRELSGIRPRSIASGSSYAPRRSGSTIVVHKTNPAQSNSVLSTHHRNVSSSHQERVARQAVTNHSERLNPLEQRSISPTNDTETKSKTRKNGRNKRTIAISAAACVIAVFALYANLSIVQTNNRIESAVLDQSISTESEDTVSSNADVDESAPTSGSVAKYTVSPELPKRLHIDNLNIHARIIRTGIDKQNEIKTPKNIFDTGWYEGSSLPNEPGAVFINGHVSGPTKTGVFYKLSKLNIGDVIQVELGDNSRISYSIVAKEEVSTDDIDMNKVLRSYDVDKQGLNLMTCSGTYDKQDKEYDKRQIVYAIRN